MDDLTADLAATSQSIRDVLRAECGSRQLHAFIDGQLSLDTLLWKRAAELGWLGVGLPDGNGGVGLGVQGIALLHRELGRHLVPGAFISTLCAAQTLADCGDAAIQAKYLPAVVSGELQIGVPAAMHGHPATLTVADDRLHGSATELLGAPQVGVVLAPVRCDSGSPGWALVKIDGVQARLSGERLWDATRSLCTLACDAVPFTLVASDEKEAARWRDTLGMHLALAIAFDSVGAAGSILDLTIEYLKTRVQFDKPIASFQALKHRAAILHIDTELARCSAEQALRAAARQDPDRHAWCALAKVAASEVFAKVAGECVQLHGGIGFTWEHDCHLYLKRSQLNLALVDTNNTQLDFAERGLAAATQAGRSVLELRL
jgi:alkylation response protein AidB-like acyl-CoA dehydrogenase